MKNTNPWMLATIFLFGLIVGFGTGRLSFGTMPADAHLVANTAGTPAGTTAVGGANTVAPTPTLQTKPLNTYDGITKSVDSLGHFSLGDKNSKVKVVEFGDFQCPFCFRYFSATFPQILKDYIATGKIYYTFFNYPLNIHPQAPKAAEAALCAAEQDKFWEYHDLLFANQQLWSGNDNDVQVFETLAQTIGMDSGKFTTCLTSSKYADTVQKDIAAGDKKDISGTPTVFINQQKIVGAQDYYTFKKAIEDELKK